MNKKHLMIPVGTMMQAYVFIHHDGYYPGMYLHVEHDIRVPLFT